MTLPKRRQSWLALLWLNLLLAPGAARAGAWPEPKGHWLDINSFSYYQVAVQGYNQFGRPTGNSTYSQFEFSPYIEYGASDRLTLGFQPRLQDISQSGLPGTKSSAGLVQANIFARYALYQGPAGVVSVQTQVGVPGAAGTNIPQLALPNAEYELRLLYGHNFSITPSLPGYIDAEAGYRFEFNGAADQIRLDGTIGISPAEHWQILTQSFNTISVGSYVPGESNYNLYRLQISAVRDLTPHIALQLGMWHDITGRNIALGNAGIAALWLKF